MALQTAKFFAEDIEKAFKDVLPPNAVRMLIMMNEYQQEQERAANEMLSIIKDLLKVVTLHSQSGMLMEKRLMGMENRYDGSNLVSSEDINND